MRIITAIIKAHLRLRYTQKNYVGGKSMTLKEGKTGMNLRIVSLEDSPLKTRLMTMGLIPGTKVTVLRSAPFGDPMALRIRSYNLALRREDAGKITVEAV